jgi:hypothetical protein
LYYKGSTWYLVLKMAAELVLADQVKCLNIDVEIKKKADINEVRKLIMLKSTRDAVESLFTSISSEPILKETLVKQAKYFLIGLLMYCSPKDVLDDAFMPIYFLAKYMILSYFKMAENPTDKDTVGKFKWCLDRYLKSYALWEEADKDKLASELLIQYYDIENTLDEMKQKDVVKDGNDTTQTQVKTEVKQHLEKSKDVVKTRLYQIFRDYLIEKWDKEVKKGVFTKRQIIYYIKSTILTGFEYYGDPAEIIGKYAFWDYFEEVLRTAHGLQSGTLQSDVEKLKEAESAQKIIYSTIDEFKKMMKNLVPHRPDLAIFYDEYLSTEYIRHLVNNNLFKPENLDQLVKFSMAQLQSLGSKQDDEDIPRWLEKWDIIQSCPYEMYEVLPYVLRDIINKTERIMGIKNLITGINESSVSDVSAPTSDQDSSTK